MKNFFRKTLNFVVGGTLLTIVVARADDFVPGTLAYHVLTNSLASTNGFDPSSGLCLQETVSGYRWNTKLWLYKFPEITSINSGLGQGAMGQVPGTYGMQLITRRHAIQAHHVSWANPVGAPVTFTDKRGVVFTNYVQSMTNFSDDINVIQLRDELPSQFVPFPLLPTNFASYLPSTANGRQSNLKLPIIAGTYDRHLYFMGLLSVFNDPFGGKGANGIRGWISYDGGSANGPDRWITNRIGLGWGETSEPYYIKRGDSGRPIMMIVGNHLVLLSSIYSYGNAPDYASAAPKIQECIDALTVAAGEKMGKYKLKTCDLSSFPKYP